MTFRAGMVSGTELFHALQEQRLGGLKLGHGASAARPFIANSAAGL
jgi:hypothetical protein